MESRSIRREDIVLQRAQKPLFVALCVGAMCGHALAQDQEDNGIGVGKTKVFDNRSLVIMLEQLEASLRATQFIDQKKLAEHLGLLQGFRQSDIARSFEVGTLPLPGKELTSSLETTTKADTTESKSSETEKASQSAFQPKAPALPDQLPPVEAERKFGISSEDLLSEQVNLTYQIFNLRMMLERAQSDRYLPGEGGGQRLQGVLGWQISVDPPKKYKGAAAVVEITIAPGSSHKGPVSLVSLMPQEKTYNVAALDRRANAFGASAIAKIITVGYSERRQGQTYFLFRDSDTSAFERHSNDNTITFGWVFRPTLNRKAVEPKLRQVFAVVALPQADTVGASAPNTTPQDANLEVTIRSYWVNYDQKTGARETAVRKSSETKNATPYQVTVFSGEVVNSGLVPQVEAVTWENTGSDSVLIDVLGNNFYQGTTILLGGRSYTSPENGLLIKSDHHVQVSAPLAALVEHGGLVNGRYGKSVPLSRGCTHATRPEQGVAIMEPRWRPEPGRSTASLTITVTPRDGTDLSNYPHFCGRNPVVKVGNYVVADTIRRQEVPNIDDYERDRDGNFVFDANGNIRAVKIQGINLAVEVPLDLLSKEQPITVSVPFLGSRYFARSFVYPGSGVRQVMRLVDGESPILGITGHGFSDKTSVFADKLYTACNPTPTQNCELELVGSSLLRLKLPKKTLADLRSIAVLGNPSDQPIIVPIPPAKPAPEKAKVNTPHLEARVNSALGHVIEGTNLTEVRRVTFEDKELKFDPGAEKIKVFLTREVTKVAGSEVEILLVMNDGSVIPVKIRVLP